VERAGAGLQKIVVQSLGRMPASDAPVLAWPLVCGTAVADKTQAFEFTDGVLCVQVPDATWRSQLLGLAPQYLAAVNQFVNHSVKRIAFLLPGEVAHRQRQNDATSAEGSEAAQSRKRA
jgi:predicted nucleic acid-binding Zn ribbon protein